MTRPPAPGTQPCPWPTCPQRTKPRYLMCREHWYALPEDIRARINETYRPGQNALSASPAYRAALRDALDYARHTANPADPATQKNSDEIPSEKNRADLAGALKRIRALENDMRDAFALIRGLDRLRPTCVICLDATATRQTSRSPACTDCVGDLPDDGPDLDHPETWPFPGPGKFALRPF
jgi:hypothetical protein